MNLFVRFIVLMWAFMGVTIAQDKPNSNPQLLFQDNGTPRAILLERLDTHVEIRGLLAETTTTMVFRNPHTRVLEGELDFPLPEGATISGYGLDVDGQLVEGVVVQKDKARVAFETEVRKGVDPGLVEWTRGNRFQTRVYPIPSQGTRTVMVRHVSEIDGDGKQGVFVLPMAFDSPIQDVNLKIEIVRGTHKPKVLGGLANFSFEQWEDRWVAEHNATAVVLDEDIRIALPKLPEQLVSIEQDQGETYFVIHDAPPETEIHSKAPSRVALFWDASLSREAEDKTQELDFLRALLTRWKQVEIHVILLRDRTEVLGQFNIQKGNAQPLIEALEQVVYDGGTDLSAVTKTHIGSAELVLLFSDGLHNIGTQLPATNAAPIYPITHRSNANHILLRHLASASGGEHMNLTRKEPALAASQVGDGRLRFMGVEVKRGEIDEVYPRGHQPTDGRFEVSGRLLSEKAHVVLTYGTAGKVSHRIPVHLDAAESSNTGLVPRFWAQQKVAELAVFAERNAEQLIQLGRRHGLVTPNTSLLVLETLQQHLEHDVEPPESRPEMREAWRAHKAVIAKNTDEEKQSQLNRVMELWKTKVNWWETDFTNWKKVLEDKTRPREDVAEFAEEPEDDAGAMFEPPTPRRQAGQTSVSAEAMSAAPMALENAVGAPSVAKKAEGKRGTVATIQIGAWDPKTPYMAIIKKAHERGRAYESYIDQRVGYGDSPSYFLDVATWLYAQGETEQARRVLSSILDLDLDDPALLRVVAHRLVEAKDFDLAISIFEDVLNMRPEEPQSHRDLALALSRRGEARTNRYQSRVDDQSLADMERALALLHHVVMSKWNRFAEIEIIALTELNRLWAMADEMDAGGRKDLVRPELDKRLIRNMEMDLRIVLAWDADLTDIDLWVTEPTGEKAFYGNQRSTIGGAVSRDFTQGYGPESYNLRQLIPGSYKIEANYYGSRQQTLVGPATVKAIVFTNYGRPNEYRQEITLRLENTKDAFLVGTVELDEASLQTQ